MPTYEYQCRKCRKRFERFQSMTAGPVRKCPSCGGAVKRLMSGGGGLIFKGTGFYSTDYKRSGAKGTSGAPASPVKDSVPASKSDKKE